MGTQENCTRIDSLLNIIIFLHILFHASNFIDVIVSQENERKKKEKEK